VLNAHFHVMQVTKSGSLCADSMELGCTLISGRTRVANDMRSRSKFPHRFVRTRACSRLTVASDMSA
jgi:hypothetical protein